MLNHLKSEANIAYTENGAVTNASTMSDCLDLFAGIGALRAADDQEIIRRFVRAYAEDADIAMKILFFGRDVRGGLGERRVFRVIINWLAENRAESLRKNIELIPEFGRYDDLVSLIGTACEKDALRTIRKQLEADLASDAEVSLLAKWLPSVNASNAETVRKAKRIARYLGMSDAEYRKTLVELRKKIRIIENYLREKDYSFDYAKQPSKAMFKYRKAFLRNDGERYNAFLEAVSSGEKQLHADNRAPAAMKCAFGENPKGCYGHDKRQSPMTRMAVAALLRELLLRTLRYRDDKAAGKNPAFDMKLEAMLPVVNGEIPLKCHAHRADDILTAVRIAREFGLKLTLDHCTDGELIADELAKEQVPVFVGPSFGGKTKVELRNKSFTTAGTLYRAGLTVSIITDAPVIPLQYLPLAAGLAASAGLPMEEAWRAITINPARSLGIDARVGSLEPGKDADLVLWTADPLTTIGGEAWMTFVNGEVVYRAE